jgi:hypothetical protein
VSYSHSILSEQKRAEEALRSSEAYLAEAQRLSQTGSWAWSAATGEPTDGRRRAIACWVSNQLSTRRYERHFFSGFIRTIKPLSRNEPRKASAISWISNLTTESFIRIKGSGTFTAYATRSSIDLGIVGDTKTSEFAGDPASPGAPRGPSVWPPRFPSRSPKLIHLEKPTPEMAY